MRRKRARECVPDLEIEFVGTGVPDGPFCRIFKSATCRNFNDMLASKITYYRRAAQTLSSKQMYFQNLLHRR